MKLKLLYFKKIFANRRRINLTAKITN